MFCYNFTIKKGLFWLFKRMLPLCEYHVCFVRSHILIANLLKLGNFLNVFDENLPFSHHRSSWNLVFKAASVKETNPDVRRLIHRHLLICFERIVWLLKSSSTKLKALSSACHITITARSCSLSCYNKT